MSNGGLRISIKALQSGATSQRAKAELQKLADLPVLDSANVRSLAALFIKLAPAGEVTEAERDRLLELVERLPGEG